MTHLKSRRSQPYSALRLQSTLAVGSSSTLAINNLREATWLYLEDFPLEQKGQPLLTTSEVAA